MYSAPGSRVVWQLLAVVITVMASPATMGRPSVELSKMTSRTYRSADRSAFAPLVELWKETLHLASKYAQNEARMLQPCVKRLITAHYPLAQVEFT
jgi:hypothetical protein